MPDQGDQVVFHRGGDETGRGLSGRRAAGIVGFAGPTVPDESQCVVFSLNGGDFLGLPDGFQLSVPLAVFVSEMKPTGLAIVHLKCPIAGKGTFGIEEKWTEEEENGKKVHGAATESSEGCAEMRGETSRQVRWLD